MPELSGSIGEDGVHRYPVRVYYEDTDSGGIVYHANYLRFAERARSAMLRVLGFTHGWLQENEGVSFAVRRQEIDFKAPAKLDDTLEVETRIADIGGASFAVAQSIRRNGQEIVHTDVKLATLNPGGRPARLPAPVREALMTLFERQRRVD